MAFNKAKALQEANKYVTQGKIAQAIKQYQWIVEKDPADFTLLNVIGDLYVHENKVREALKYFYRLADAYTKEKYKVQAIAIYKKISKFDRTSAEPFLKLAELNAAQGLTREAREQYKNAFEFFERANQKESALGVMREICRLDPQDHALRLQLAQFADRAGEAKEAVAAYLEAAALAQAGGDFSAAESALEKAGELSPTNPDVHLCRAKLALANKKPEEVKAILDSAPELQSNSHALRLLFGSYLAAGDLDAARGLLLDVFRSDLSDFSPVAEISSRCIERHQYNEVLEILTAIAPGMIERRDTAPLMETLRQLWKSTPDHIDTLEFIYQVAEKTADEAVIPDVLEALGNAYVQTGRLQGAELAYTRLVVREPENEVYKDLLKQVLEKQGKVCVPPVQTPLANADVAVDIGPVRADSLLDFGRAAEDLLETHAARGESSLVEQYHEEPHGLVQTAPSVEADSGSTSTDTTLAEARAESFHPPAPVRIDLSQPVDGQGPQGEDLELPPPKDISLEFQTDHRSDQIAEGVSSSVRASTPDQKVAASVQHSPSPDRLSGFNYQESREEIEFYLRHAFYDEARKAVSSLETKFPAESRVADLRQLVDEKSRRADAKKAADKTREKEWELPTSFSETGYARDPAGKLRGNQGRQDVTERLSDELVSTLDNFDNLPKTASTDATKHGGEIHPRSPEDASAELGSLLDDLNDASEQVDQAADDDQTHYNLGVAFREMGLLDEAIGEFQKVAKHGGPSGYSPKFLQGCTLLAACFMDKGMPGIAAKWYSRALEAPGLGHDGTVALYYDMGIAFEKAGNAEAALEKFTEVYSQNIDYRDVAEKIRLLRKSAS